MKTNRSELTDIFGVSLRTIAGWVKQGCPVVQKGRKFDTGAVYSWFEAQTLQSVVDETPDLNEARRRKLLAEAEKAELD